MIQPPATGRGERTALGLHEPASTRASLANLTLVKRRGSVGPARGSPREHLAADQQPQKSSDRNHIEEDAIGQPRLDPTA